MGRHVLLGWLLLLLLLLWWLLYVIIGSHSSSALLDLPVDLSDLHLLLCVHLPRLLIKPVIEPITHIRTRSPPRLISQRVHISRVDGLVGVRQAEGVVSWGAG